LPRLLAEIVAASVADVILLDNRRHDRAWE